MFRKPKRNKTRRNTARRHFLEALETRQMFSGISIVQSGSELFLYGSESRDHVQVEAHGSQLRVIEFHPNMRSGTVPASESAVLKDDWSMSVNGITRITFYGYGGDDEFRNYADIPTTAFGYAGNDELTGGPGDDKLYGMDGHDTLYGMVGGDMLDGGDGRDRLFGMSGSDTLLGQGGDDELQGGLGEDWLYGGADNDLLYEAETDTSRNHLFGEGGDDRLYGGASADRIEGGLGHDYLAGRDGDDILIGGVGNDRLDAGSGSNVLYIGSGNDVVAPSSGNDQVYLEDIGQATLHEAVQRMNEGVRELRGETLNKIIDIGLGMDLPLFAENIAAAFDIPELLRAATNISLQLPESDDAMELFDSIRRQLAADPRFTVEYFNVLPDANGDLLRLRFRDKVSGPQASFVAGGETGFDYLDQDVVGTLQGSVVSQTGTLNIDVVFGIDQQTDGSLAFYVADTSGVSISDVQGSAELAGSLDIRALIEVDARATASLQIANASMTFADADGDHKLRIDQLLDSVRSDIDGRVNIDQATFTTDFPVLSAIDWNASGEIIIIDGQWSAPTFELQMPEVSGFVESVVTEFLSSKGADLAGWIDELLDFEIPMANTSLGDFLGFDSSILDAFQELSQPTLPEVMALLQAVAAIDGIQVSKQLLSDPVGTLREVLQGNRVQLISLDMNADVWREAMQAVVRQVAHLLNESMQGLGSGTLDKIIDAGLGLDLPLFAESLAEAFDISDLVRQATDISLQVPEVGSVLELLDSIRTQLEQDPRFTIEYLDVQPDANGDLLRLRYRDELANPGALLDIDGETGFDYLDAGVSGNLSGAVDAKAGPLLIDLVVGIDQQPNGDLGFYVSEESSIAMTGVTGSADIEGNLGIRSLVSVKAKATASLNIERAGFRLTDDDDNDDAKLRTGELLGSVRSDIDGHVNIDNATFTTDLPVLSAINWKAVGEILIVDGQWSTPTFELEMPEVGGFIKNVVTGFFAGTGGIGVGNLSSQIGEWLNVELPVVDKSLGDVLGFEAGILDAFGGLSLPGLTDVTAMLKAVDDIEGVRVGEQLLNDPVGALQDVIEGERVQLISFEKAGGESWSDGYSTPLAVIPVLPFLSLNVSAAVTPHAYWEYYVGMGVDTTGFWIDPATHVGVGGGVDAGILATASLFGLFDLAKIEVGAGIDLWAEIGVVDPDPSDGGLYLDEIFGDKEKDLVESVLSVLSVDVGGDINGYVRASIKVPIIGSITVLNESIEVGEIASTSQPPARTTSLREHVLSVDAALVLPIVEESGERVLLIQGTDGPDRVLLSRQDGLVHVNWRGKGQGEFASIDRVRFQGGDGNDLLDATPEFDLPIEAYGGAGKDILRGGLAHDHLEGGDGADTIKGRGGNDVIRGGEESDFIWAGEGNDDIDGGGGGDVIRGGEDDDTIVGGPGNDRLYGDSGNDQVMGGDGNDVLLGGIGDDVLEGGQGSDHLDGERGDDVLSGGADDDELFGGADNDVLRGGLGNDVLNGGTGDDQLYGEHGDDSLFGEDGDDLLVGGADSVPNGISDVDTLHGGAGRDDIRGGADQDYFLIDSRSADGQGLVDSLQGGLDRDFVVVLGTELGDDIDVDFDATTGQYIVSSKLRSEDTTTMGNQGLMSSSWTTSFTLPADIDQVIIDAREGDDVVRVRADVLNGIDMLGGAGDDTLIGGGGNDTIDGGEGNDTLRGGGGDDVLIGSTGEDQLFGEAGNDVLRGGIGNDRLDGGEDRDYLFGDMGTDYLFAGAGIYGDVMRGGEGDDVLEGGDGVDHMFGEAGNDILFGGGMGDLLDGGADHDRLVGEEGRDTILGQGGNDQLWALYNDDLRTASGLSARISASVDYVSLVAEEARLNEELAKATDPADLRRISDELAVVRSKLIDSSALQSVLVDTLMGGSDDDDLYGSPFADVLIGDSGNDRFFHSTGDDIVFGGEGDQDTYVVAGTDDADAIQIAPDFESGDGDEIIVEVNGESVSVPPSEIEVVRVDAQSGNDTVTVNLGQKVSEVRSLILNGGDGDDNLTAATFEGIGVTIHGGQGNDSIHGGPGNDVLHGGGGNDEVYGNGGFDTIDGGPGKDRLTGGADVDNFRIDLADEGDTLADFAPSADTLTFSVPSQVVKHQVHPIDGSIYTLRSGHRLFIGGSHVDGNIQDFAIDAAGRQYRLTVDGTLKRYAGGWTTLAVDVVKFAIHPNGRLYTLHTNQTVRLNIGIETHDPFWAGTRDFYIRSDGSLYHLNINGVLQRQAPNGSWDDPMYSNVLKMSFNHAGQLYTLHTDGVVRVDGGNLWAGTADIHFLPDGSMLWLGTNGILQKIGANRVVQETPYSDVQKVAVHADSRVLTLHFDGDLRVNGTVEQPRVRHFELSNNGNFSSLDDKGVLVEKSSSGESSTSDVLRFAYAPDGSRYTLFADGRLHHTTEGTWSNTKDFALRNDGTLYWLGHNLQLQIRRPGAGFETLYSDVEKMVLTGIDDLYTQHTSNVVRKNGSVDWRGVIDFTVREDGAIYLLHADGYLAKYTTATGYVAPFDNATYADVLKFDFDTAGRLFTLHKSQQLRIDGHVEYTTVFRFLLRHDGTYYVHYGTGELDYGSVDAGVRRVAATPDTQFNDVVKFAVRPNGTTLFTLHKDEVVRADGRDVWGNTRDFDIRPDGILYWLGTGKQLMKLDPARGWDYAATIYDVNKFEFSRDGDLYALKDNNDLLVNGSLVWTGTRDFALRPDGTLYYLSTNHQLWTYDRTHGWGWHDHTRSGWQREQVYSDVVKFQFDFTGALYTLHTNGYMKIAHLQLYESRLSQLLLYDYFWGGTADFRLNKDRTIDLWYGVIGSHDGRHDLWHPAHGWKTL